MTRSEENKIAYLVACISEFANDTGLTQQESFRYLRVHGGITFLNEHYEVEHLLPIEQVVDDLKLIAQQSGGMVS
jgi:hypothetical protein